jgi:hypothetical protein
MVIFVAVRIFRNDFKFLMEWRGKMEYKLQTLRNNLRVFKKQGM